MSSRSEFPDADFRRYCNIAESNPQKLNMSFFQKALSQYPYSPYFCLKLGGFYYDQNDLRKSKEILAKGLHTYESNVDMNKEYYNSSPIENLKMELLTLKLHVLEKLMAPADEMQAVLLGLKEELENNSQGNNEEILHKLKKIAEKHKISLTKPQLRYKRSLDNVPFPSDVHEEAREVFSLMESSNSQNFMKEEGFPVNLISMSWFSRWKRFTNFYLLSGEKYEDNSMEFSQDIEGNVRKPGPINQDDILSKESMLIDPDKIKNYCNMILRAGLEENKDFLIVPHKVWKYLYKIYGGQEIKRFIVSVNDDSNLTHVELFLKKINVIMWPLVNKHEITKDVLYLSRKEAIKDLKEKLFRIYSLTYKIDDKYKNLGNSKIWKVDSKAHIEEIIEEFNNFSLNSGNLRSSNKKLAIKGKKLEDSSPLEESELSETDYVIVEYKIGEEWILTSEEKAQNQSKLCCAYCKAANKPLSFCECRQVKYCDLICLKKHRPEHKESCIKAKREINSTNDMLRHFGINVNKKFTKDSKKGVTGLQNLGNTCFMNSSLQCLSNTAELTQYFLTNEFLKDLNKNNPLGTGGYLISAYSELIKELWMGNDSYVSPWNIKKVIGKFAPQFSGYSQQDSQELLSYLLDGLHEDLNRVIKKPFVEDIEYNGQKDEDLSIESWNNYLKRNQSIIMDLFAGQYKSRLDCPDCKKISITFDPFLSISLPVPHVITFNITFYFIFKDSKILPYKMTPALPAENKCSDLLEYCEKSLKISKENMMICLMKDNNIKETVNPEKSLKVLDEYERENILVYEFDNIPSKEESIIKINLSISCLKKRGDISKDVSYCRCFRFSLRNTFEQLHIKIYKYFRVYIKNFITSFDENKPEDFQIDLENEDIKTLKSEYLNMFFSKNFDPPYKLYYMKADEKIELVYSSNKSFSEMVHDKEPQEYEISFLLIFASYIKPEELKMNRFQESPLEEKSKDLKKSTIYDCLDLFTKEEILDAENAWYCSNCKTHKQAKKKMEIYKTPKILILHLKRFKTSKINSIGTYYYTSGSSKISNFVEFPLKEMNLNHYIKSKSSGIYDLFAVSNHYGGLYGGHYTASCLNFMDGKWYEFNDSMTEIIRDTDKIVSEAAYVLFYRKREVNHEHVLTQQPLLLG